MKSRPAPKKQPRPPSPAARKQVGKAEEKAAERAEERDHLSEKRGEG